MNSLLDEGKIDATRWICSKSPVVILFLVLALPGLAQVLPTNREDVAFAEPDYSPYVGRSYPSQVFWGDTHLHTALSTDAGAFGNRLGLDEAYRFARGEEVRSSTGLRARLSRPLDFLVVADHTDGMGFFPLLQSGDPMMMSNATAGAGID